MERDHLGDIMIFMCYGDDDDDDDDDWRMID